MTMCVTGTRVTQEHEGLWVKHEEECCPGGPNFSKTRGVWTHVAHRMGRVIGVLDTVHSQGGWAVARACALQGRRCVEFYPVRKADTGKPLGTVQENCRRLGADTLPLPAGRSAVLYHRARAALRETHGDDSYMMPNALKLPETVSETADEVARTTLPPDLDTVIISASSGTIAAGLLRGLRRMGWSGMLVVHMGYSRPLGAVMRYLEAAASLPLLMGGSRVVASAGDVVVRLVDEGYAYADEARGVPGCFIPTWPCNTHYDLKVLSWWARGGHRDCGRTLLWNVG